jgi:hypothetical protein
MDLVFVNDTGTHQVWHGTATGFSLSAEQIAEPGAITGIVADLGNDGGLDLALSTGTSSGADLFLNDGFGNIGLGDAVEPILTLRGQASVSVPAGSTYVDQGADASDNIDGDITDSIAVTNPVNSNLVGNYTVTYNVTDFAGNKAQPVTRTVNVTPAAGTGGGGGGLVGPWTLLILLLAIAGRRRLWACTIRLRTCSANRRK